MSTFHVASSPSKHRLRLALLIALLVALAVALMPVSMPTAHADPQSTPNGPWLQPQQEVNLSRLVTNEELASRLAQIEHASQGTVQLEVVGQSVLGRDIHMATVGDGPARVLYITQQHGDEPLGTEAALRLLQYMGGNSADARDLRERATLFIIPRVNPDGAEVFRRTNENGADINRFHHLAPDDNPVPEAATVRRVHAEHQPDVVVDYHHQGSYRAADGRSITMSVFWPIASGVSADVVERSQQVSLRIFDAVGKYGHGEVSRYPGSTNPAIARNAYGLLGSASVLVEQRGQTDTLGQKSSGMLIRQALVAMHQVLQGAADGSLWDIDASRIAEMPPRGPSIGRPNQEEIFDEVE